MGAIRRFIRAWGLVGAVHVLAVTLSIGASTARAQEPASSKTLGSTALPAAVSSALKQAGIPNGAVGAYVQEIGAARPILSFNAQQPMNPASVMKLVTTYAGLELLGPVFTWKTEVYATRSLTGDVLEGDLLLRGSGDPKLTLENFWLLLKNLRTRGLREIRGDLVLDRGAFESSETDSVKFDAEPLRPYNVGPDALLVNFKAVRFQFIPDPERGTVRVAMEPRLAQIELSQNVKLVQGGCGDWRAGLKVDVQDDSRNARVVFAGAMPASCGEHSWYLGLLSHPNYVYGVFKDLWEELGGTLRGTWRDGVVPTDARLLATAESPTLTEIVRDINKFSNNVMARHLFLSLSGEILKTPARTDRTRRVVRSWLEHKGLDLPELIMENGSGLSRVERISAGGMGRMLAVAFQSAVMPEFMSSMPLVAYDGTMKRRLKFEPIAGQAHIKTGSLNDVRTLAGYMLDRTGRRYAMAFFINHPNAGQAQPAQDAFLRWLYEGAGTKPN